MITNQADVKSRTDCALIYVKFRATLYYDSVLAQFMVYH